MSERWECLSEAGPIRQGLCASEHLRHDLQFEFSNAVNGTEL